MIIQNKNPYWFCIFLILNIQNIIAQTISIEKYVGGQIKKRAHSQNQDTFCVENLFENGITLSFGTIRRITSIQIKLLLEKNMAKLCLKFVHLDTRNPFQSAQSAQSVFPLYHNQIIFCAFLF
jgi:hypothetical protein